MPSTSPTYSWPLLSTPGCCNSRKSNFSHFSKSHSLLLHFKTNEILFTLSNTYINKSVWDEGYKRLNYAQSKGKCRMLTVRVLFVFDYNSFINLHFKFKPDLNNLLIKICDDFKSHSSVEFEMNHCLD